MPSPTEQKKILKNKILNTLSKTTTADKAKLIALMSLESGFKPQTIEIMLEQLALTGFINIEGNEIKGVK